MGLQSDSADLTKGSIWRSIWHMSWAMLLVMFFNFLVGLTDIYVAGFLGPDIQAIVGFVGELYFFIIIVANAISIGMVAILSREIGSRNFVGAMSIARQALLLGFLSALLLTVAGILFYEDLVSLAGFPPDVNLYAREFFIIYALALVPNYIVILANAVFRAGGDVRLSVIAMFCVSIVNIVLDFLFVFGISSFQGMGFKGIAIATATSMYAGTAICIWLFRDSRWRDVFSGRWFLSLSLARKIFALSWPAALLQVSWNAGNIALYNILGRLQEGSIVSMAALTNGLRVEAVIYLPVFALNMSGSVLTGQNLGAGAPERAVNIGWKISLSGVVFVSLMAIPVFIWAWPVASLVAQDQYVLAETARYLKIMMFSEPFMALSLILGGCLMGAGDTRGTMLVVVSALWIIRLPLAYFLAFNAEYGASGVWIAMVISMLFQGAVMTDRFRRGRWKDLKV